jgi:type II secretion system protein N
MRAKLNIRETRIGGGSKLWPPKFIISCAFFGYLLVGALILLFFLYLRFPGDAVKSYLKAASGARYPAMLFVIDSVEPVIPPGIEIKNITAGLRERPEATLHTDSLKFFPLWLSILQGKAALKTSIVLYGGELSGSGGFARPFSLEGPFSATARFEGIRLEKCLMLHDFMTRQVSGTLKGAFAASGVAGPLKDVVVKLDVTVANGSYQLLENLAGFDKINFNRIDLKMELKSGVLKISNITVNGDKLRITLKGNILLADDLQESRMDLTGSLELQGLGGRRMPIVIGGVFGKPTMKLM